MITEQWGNIGFECIGCICCSDALFEVFHELYISRKFQILMIQKIINILDVIKTYIKGDKHYLMKDTNIYQMLGFFDFVRWRAPGVTVTDVLPASIDGGSERDPSGGRRRCRGTAVELFPNHIPLYRHGNGWGEIRWGDPGPRNKKALHFLFQTSSGYAADHFPDWTGSPCPGLHSSPEGSPQRVGGRTGQQPVEGRRRGPTVENDRDCCKPRGKSSRGVWRSLGVGF